MDPQQQFCLKWNSYSSNLAMTFSNLFKSELLADVTLFCGGTVFKAHKLILAACSKNFAELFESAPTSASCLVILEATSSENMAALLEFMYKGEVHVSQEALNGFLKAAENLQVKGLSTEHGRLAAAQSHSHDDCPMDGCRSPSPSHDHDHPAHHHHHQHQQQHHHHHRPHHHHPGGSGQQQQSQQQSSQQQQQQSSQQQQQQSNSSGTGGSGGGGGGGSSSHQQSGRSNCASPVTPQHGSGGGCTLKSGGGGDCGESVTMHPSTPVGMTQFSPYMPSIANMPNLSGMATMSSITNMYQQHRPIPYDQPNARKRTQQRSPTYNEAECSRQSVLRDGSRSSAEDCSPGSKGYRPASNASSNAPIECEAVHTERLSPPSRYDTASPSTSAAANGSINAANNDNNDSNHHSRSPHGKQEASSSRNSNSAGAQDLRVKMESYDSVPQASSSSGLSMSTPTALVSFIEKNSGDSSLSASLAASIAPADMLNVWNATKMNQKGGTVNTADGKKLKCLYCDRLYGYETNLRAHIRQRHQGIRVPCPFCSRTFTRNNTVRRHIAREHKHELGLTDSAGANDPESPTPAESTSGTGVGGSASASAPAASGTSSSPSTPTPSSATAMQTS